MSSTIGYLQLIKSRPAFRRIWLGSVVSLAGDWFSLLALYALLEEETGSAESVGLLLAARFLPSALIAPIGGALADRFSRRRIMVACDVLRALIMLGFLAVRTKADVPLVYLLTVAQMSLSALFEPAEQAAVGSVVEPSEVVTATTIQSMTWAAALSAGALLGGLTTELFGRQGAFIVDAFSYLASAFFIARAAIPHHPRVAGALLHQGIADVREGLSLAARDGLLRRVLWVKTGWGVAGGGALALYAMMGERELKVGTTGTAAVGVLLAMRGVGALLGPLLARRFGGDSQRFLLRAINVSFAITIIGWVAFSQAPTLMLAACCLAVAHMATSVMWTFSSSLLTMLVDDRLRGRIFSIDLMSYTVTFTLSSWLAGRALDRLGATPREVMLALACLLVGSWGVWLALAPERPTSI